MALPPLAEAPASLPKSSSTAAKGWMRDRPWLPAAVAGSAALLFSYAPNFQDLATIWNNEPNYSHGFLILPIALVILWQKMTASPYRWTSYRAPWWSWAALAVVVGARVYFYESSRYWLETATFIPVVACLIFALGGKELFARSWPAVAFLVFMLPLPPSLNSMVALPLQRIATRGSCFVLQLTGLWVVPEGNVIMLSTPRGPEHLEVALACNGLSMLMTLAATVIATVTLVPMPLWKRLSILASAVPIALISNVSRIVATGWCYYYVEGERAKHLAHDWSGYLMMPLALTLVWLEYCVLSWLFDESAAELEVGELPISPMFTQQRTS